MHIRRDDEQGGVPSGRDWRPAFLARPRRLDRYGRARARSRPALRRSGEPIRAGEKWWPDQDFERDHVKPEQESRFEVDAWEQEIASFLVGRERVTVTEVARSALTSRPQR